jgi:hypothetical protein
MNTKQDPFSPAALQDRYTRLGKQLKESKDQKLMLIISNILCSGVSLLTLIDFISSAYDGNFENLPTHIAIIILTATMISLNCSAKRKVIKKIHNDNLEYLRTWAMLKSPQTIDIYKAVIYKDKQI